MQSEAWLYQRGGMMLPFPVSGLGEESFGPLPARLTLHGPTPESGKNEHRPAIHDRFVFEIIAVLVAEADGQECLLPVRDNTRLAQINLEENKI